MRWLPIAILCGKLVDDCSGFYTFQNLDPLQGNIFVLNKYLELGILTLIIPGIFYSLSVFEIYHTPDIAFINNVLICTSGEMVIFCY